MQQIKRLESSCIFCGIPGGFFNSGLPTLLIQLAISLNKISRWAIVKKITIKQRMDFVPDTFRMATSKTLLFQ